MEDAGIKVLRTWVMIEIPFLDRRWHPLIYLSVQGFNAINATELEYAEETGLTYYQVCQLRVLKLRLLTDSLGLGRLGLEAQ
jgi:hypothetical protein